MWREETTTERVCVSGDQGESSYIYRTKNLVRGRDVKIWVGANGWDGGLSLTFLPPSPSSERSGHFGCRSLDSLSNKG
jgi:hypothetical protein